MKKDMCGLVIVILAMLSAISQFAFADQGKWSKEAHDHAEMRKFFASKGARDRSLTAWKIGGGKVPKCVVIKIDVEGAHLPDKQSLLFCGPFAKDYLVIPFDAGGRGIAPHKWLGNVYWANYWGMVQGKKTFVLEADVLDANQHPDLGGTSHGYIVVFETEDSSGPKAVEFSSPFHDGSTGSHGGGAHGNR